jgi:hypothetical protein
MIWGISETNSGHIQLLNAAQPFFAHIFEIIVDNSASSKILPFSYIRSTEKQLTD